MLYKLHNKPSLIEFLVSTHCLCSYYFLGHLIIEINRDAFHGTQLKTI